MKQLSKSAVVLTETVQTHLTSSSMDQLESHRLPLRNFFLRRVNSIAEADDLVQEVFLRMLKSNQDAPIENIQSYLFRVGTNTFRDYLRNKASRKADMHQPIEDTVEIESGLSTERVLIGQQSVEILTEALKTLPTRTRDIFVLRALQNRPFSEIAQLLELSTRSVEKHMAKALTLLEQKILGTN